MDAFYEFSAYFLDQRELQSSTDITYCVQEHMLHQGKSWLLIGYSYAKACV